MYENMQVFPDQQWAEMAAAVINKAVQDIAKLKGSCSVMLTGGRGAEQIYRAWSNLLPQDLVLSFYFGDERCVSPTAIESNYGLALRSLFKDGISVKHLVYRIHGESEDPVAEAVRYNSVLPVQIDILLVSMGEDGHIASVFPGDRSIHKNKAGVTLVSGPKPPNPRITVTPAFITSAANVFCLVNGELKSATLARVFTGNDNVTDLPVKLVVEARWLIDQSAAILLPKQDVNNNI